MRDIDTSKAAGTDRLPGRFLKDGTNVLTKPVTDICNLSVSLNKFPRAFKLAKVKPIFKKGCKTNVSNYRPISLLPILSKVIEKGPKQTGRSYTDIDKNKWRMLKCCNIQTKETLFCLETLNSYWQDFKFIFTQVYTQFSVSKKTYLTA